MSATLLVHGTIRTVKDRVAKTGTPYREVSILTEFGPILGETVTVLLFNPREGEEAPLVADGLVVNWVIEVEARGGYLNGRFRAVATSEDFHSALRAAGVPRPESASV